MDSKLKAPVSSVIDLAWDQKGNLWMGFADHLQSFSMPELKLLESHPISVQTILCDRQGNIWIGSVDGLAELPNRPLRTVPDIDQEGDRDVWNICAARDGGVWIGTTRNLRKVRDGMVRRYHFQIARTHPLQAPVIRGICEMPDGDLWAGGNLLYHLRDSVEGEHQKVDIFCLGETMNAISPAPGNQPLISAYSEIQVRNGKLVDARQEKDLPVGGYLGIFCARNGDAWYGTEGHGIIQFRKGNRTIFTTSHGLPGNVAAVGHEDEEGALWILTDRGVSRLKDGVFANIGSREGLHSDQVLAMLDDQLGNYWFNSHHGIFRVSKKEMNEFADSKRKSVQSVVYGIADGAPSLEGNASGLPNSCRSADGRLWFPTTGGAVVVHPKDAIANDEAPQVFIEQVRAHERDLLAEPQTRDKNRTPFTISPGQGRALIFRYAAIEFSAPDKAQFKYRLEEYDTSWVDAGNQRFAVYAGLPPGNYLFRVIACNRRGIWNQTGASFAFTILPFFYQTWSFRVACVAIGMTALAAISIHRFKTQRRILQLEQAAALAKERERIARDLHDDLGASLTRIAMLSDAARNQTNGHAAESQIDRISHISRELVDNMGQLVWAANPKYDDLQSFAAYIREYAAQLLGPLGVKFQFELRPANPKMPLSAEVRRDLFLVIKEALNNSLKYACPRKIDLTLKADPGILEIIVSDDGCGFSIDRAQSGNGLTNMRQRIEKLGGGIEISSEPNSGTTIAIQLPRANCQDPLPSAKRI
jgi:signal transduction histidine kinase